MNNYLKTIGRLAIVIAVALALVPMSSASAQGENPPADGIRNERLEKAWARQQRIYFKLGNTFENAEARIARAQEMIDKASGNGKDVSSLQAALDSFGSSVNNARPIYENMKGIVDSHEGFDQNGRVTDPEKAKSTVRAMHTKLTDIKTTLHGSGRALIEAFKAFREANQPARNSIRRDS